MSFRLSAHACVEMQRRGIPQAVLEAALEVPEQKVPAHGTILCYQSRVTIDGKSYLLRVMVDETQHPPVVVTVYRTSKIGKYWRAT